MPEDSIDLVAEDAPPKAEAPVPVAFLCVRCWKTFPSWSAAICPSCGTVRPIHGWATMPYTFRDRYLFWRPLGRGGMGAVFLAYDEHQNEGERRPVAVKVIPESHSERERVALSRFFEREAAAAAMLAQSPCFVRVTSHDVGVSPAYMAMEYVEWPTLRDLLRPAKSKTPRPLPPIRAAKLGIALLRGVSVMHFHRIVHRDLKPDNVFVARVSDEDDYRIKILDLGVWTKDASDRSFSPTLIGPEAAHERAPVGTYSYMSPEQMEGRPVGCASDLHTIGSLIWELVTGRVPFPFDRRAPEPAALLERRERLKLELKRPDVMPEDLFQILAKALAYDPQDRWESAEDLRTALRVFVAEEAKHREEVVRATNRRLEDFLGHVEALRGKIRPASEVLVRADRIADTIARYRSVVVETEPHRLKSSLDSIEASIEQLDRSVSQLVGHLAGAEARPFATVDVPPAVTKDLREHAARAPSRLGLLAGALFLGIAAGLLGFALRAERPIPSVPAPAVRAEARLEAAAVVEPPPEVALARGPLRLAVHPTEGRALAVGRDFSIVGFELARGRVEADLPGEAAALDLALAPDGGRFALAGDDGAVRVYERGAARPSLVLRAISRPRALVFAADGASLWVGDAEGRLHQVSPDSGRIELTVATRPRRGRSAPAGEPVVALAALQRGDEAWVAAATGAAVFELGPRGGLLHPTPGRPRALASTPRGDLWAGLDSGEVVRLGPAGELVARAKAHTGAVRALAADGDGGVVSGGEDHQIAFVAGDGAVRRALARPAAIAAIARAADGRLVVGEEDGHLTIFGDPTRAPVVERGPSHTPLGGLAVDPERGLSVVLGLDRRPEVSRVEDGAALGPLDGPPAVALARADDGALATVDGGGTIRVFAPGATAPTLAIASSIGEPRALGLSRAVVAVGGADGRLEVFARSSGQPLHRAQTGRGAIEAIAVSAGEVIFGGEERALRRLELGASLEEALRRRVSVLARAHDGAIRAIAAAPDGRFASAGDDGRVRVWAADGTLLRSADAHEGPVRALAFSLDGGRLASGGSDGRVREMALGGDPAVAEWSAHRGPVLGLAAVAGGWLSAGPDGFLVRSGAHGYRRRPVAD